MTDLELITLCKKRDRKGQKLLFSRYCAAMTRVCHRYIKDESDTMEVVSEGFVKVFQYINNFDYQGEGGLTNWIRKIMVNESLQYIRRRQPSYVVIENDAQQLESNFNELEDFDAEYIYKAILKLPEGYRTVFNLYVIEGFNHGEIAEKLGISTSASRSQLTHAKRKLQQFLNEYKFQ